jgi:hypothetical protein
LTGYSSGVHGALIGILWMAQGLALARARIVLTDQTLTIVTAVRTRWFLVDQVADVRTGPLGIVFAMKDGQKVRSLVVGSSAFRTLSDDGASACRLPDADAGSAAASAFVRGAASDVVLALYARIPMDKLKLGGDVRVVEQLRAWDF